MNFLSLFTPNNVSKEKEIFFSSDSYNPTFEYSRDSIELKDYLLKHPSKSSFVDALLTQEPVLITKSAQKYFQTTLDKETLEDAERILSKGFGKLETEENTSEKIKESLEFALNFFNLDYKVEIVDRHGFNVRPSHPVKTLLVSKYAEVGLFSIESTVKHEITHVIRYVNKEANNIKRSAGNLATEEGLASFMGDKFNQNSLYHHAAEYKATEIGLKGSLRDIYQFFINLGYPKDFSWQRSIRHKFGFTKTIEPGDIMKPAMYFFFENKIKDLSTKQLLKLFSGKISLNDLNSIENYKGVIPEEKLITYFDL